MKLVSIITPIKYTRPGEWRVIVKKYIKWDCDTRSYYPCEGEEKIGVKQMDKILRNECGDYNFDTMKFKLLHVPTFRPTTI